MAAIDCGMNVHVADYHGISTYWPIEEQSRQLVTEMPYDKNIMLTKNNIVIGGGSGEHSAIVVNIDHAISTLAYIKDNLVLGIVGYLDKNSCTMMELQKLYDKVVTEKSLDFEFEILINVAAFVIFEMPLEHCIVDPQVLKYAQDQRINRPWEFFVGFTAVFDSRKLGKTLAPNSGKTGDCHVVWGYSLEDWYRNNGGRK